MAEPQTTQVPVWIFRLIWAAIFFALLRNMFPPNSFTATVLIFDYDQGLVRRGFWGEVLNLYWGETVSKGEVFAASAALTLVGVGALVFMLWRFLSGHIGGAKLLLLVVSSFAFAAIIGATGYIDLALIGVLSLSVLSDPSRISGVLLRCGAVALGVFMHEVMLAYFAVFLMFDVWFAKPYLRRTALAFTPLLAGIAAFAVLLVWGQVPAQDVSSYIAHIEAKSEFTAEPEATVVMERTMADNLAMMSEKRGMTDYKSWVLFDGIPLLVMSVWLIFLNLKILPAGTRGITKLLLVGAILAPLSLNVIAFDVVRFGAVSVLVGFLTILVICRAEPAAFERLNRALSWPVMVVLLVLNLNVTVNQMNTGDAQEYAVPWAMIKQLDWLK